MLDRGVCTWGAAALGSCLVLAARSVSAEEPKTPAWRANVGFVTTLGVAILVPDEGTVGGGLELSGRYGIPAGPFIVAPGGRVGGYYFQERVIGVSMAMLRVSLPLGPVAPFGHAGVGAGGLTSPGDTGLAWLAGGGFMVHFGRALALGAELNYAGITGAGYEVWSIGPLLLIGG